MYYVLFGCVQFVLEEMVVLILVVDLYDVCDWMCVVYWVQFWLVEIWDIGWCYVVCEVCLCDLQCGYQEWCGGWVDFGEVQCEDCVGLCVKFGGCYQVQLVEQFCELWIDEFCVFDVVE